MTKKLALGFLMTALGQSGCGTESGDLAGAGGGNQSANGANGVVGSTTGFGPVGPGATTGGPINTCNSDDCIKDDEQQACDTALAMDSSDAVDGARAIGLCKQAAAGGWGLVSAAFTTSHGKPLSGPMAVGTGILSSFGSVIPREGGKMLVLSSGAARAPSDPGYQQPSGYEKSNEMPHAWPSGFLLQESPKCADVMTGEPFDSAMLEMQVKTPTNAKSLSFNLDFYTYEFPEFICSPYNDYFVALMNPPPPGAIQGNISLDTTNNFISVNAGFLQACDSQTASNGEFYPCGLGYAEIVGTGYDEGNPLQTGKQNSAATSWLETVAPIETPGEVITLRFAIWDSGDEILDSTVLIDNFRFSYDSVVTGTAPVPK